MPPLREIVTIKTPIGDLHGNLYVGADHLPELEIPPPGGYWGTYRPASFPAWWSLRPLAGQASGLLLLAWNEIAAMQSRLAEAEREERDHAEEEDGETEEEELYQANARQRSIDNRVAAEIDHQRGEEVAHDQRT